MSESKLKGQGRKVIDIETNNLLSNMLDYSSLPYKLNKDARLWCIVVRDIDTDEVQELVSESGSSITKEDLRKLLEGTTEIVGHNAIKFDLLSLKLFGVLDYEVGYINKSDTLFGKDIKVTDTLVRSRLLNPDRKGGHGLAAWGKVLGDFKGDFHDFSKYTPEMLSYCITPDMRLLGKDLKWRAADTFSVGDTILGFDEENQKGRSGRRYKDAVIEVMTEDVAEVFEVTLKSGKKLKVTGEHRFLVCHTNHGHNRYVWAETKDLRSMDTNPKMFSSLPCLLPIYEQDLSFNSGWVSGMYDVEGCLTNGKYRPPTLGVSQRSTKTLEKLEKLLGQFKVNFSKHYVNKGNDCVNIKVLGGFSEVYRTLCVFRPERLIDKLDFNTFGRLEMKGRSYNDAVLSVKSIGKQKILKIQTSAKTFMCEGYPMHNCIQDAKVTTLIFNKLEKEYQGYVGWHKAEKLENKLADIAVQRETYGFWFDKEKAIACVEDLTQKMQTLADNVNPLLPPKPMTKTKLKKFTPPAIQTKKDGSLSSHMNNFAIKHGATVEDDLFIYKGLAREIPFTEPLETHEVADISDLDHIKSYLIELGWRPLEMKIRDLTKDSKKQSISYEKRVETLDRWLAQTFDEGKYKEVRLRELDMGMKVTKEVVRKSLLPRLEKDFPVRVPTSPCVRVGVEKELCPKLTALGEKVAFANDFVLYQTYKHRKSCIAGGDIEDMDFDEEYPNTGYLSMYREEDERVSTPSIEIGASTNRYRHIGIANIPRVTSVYGEEMRSLFGCGKGMFQLGFDFSSLEARIQGHYILPFDGAELAKALLAEKPNDIHTLTGLRLGLPRGDAKSIAYMLMYGGSYKKAKTMLGISDEEAKQLVEDYWNEVLPLSKLRDAVEEKWTERGKKYIIGVDGRKINTRSKHSLLNALFQSGGVICAKYSTVFAYQLMEEKGYKCNPFEHEEIDMSSMIEYHKVVALYSNIHRITSLIVWKP